MNFLVLEEIQFALSTKLSFQFNFFHFQGLKFLVQFLVLISWGLSFSVQNLIPFPSLGLSFQFCSQFSFSRFRVRDLVWGLGLGVWVRHLRLGLGVWNWILRLGFGARVLWLRFSLGVWGQELAFGVQARGLGLDL